MLKLIDTAVGPNPTAVFYPPLSVINSTGIPPTKTKSCFEGNITYFGVDYSRALLETHNVITVRFGHSSMIDSMEMIMNIPYRSRVIALMILATAMVVHDRRRGCTNRQWEYGWLFLAGIIGAIYGVVNDTITVSISPDYFELGKGLSVDSGLRHQAILLGGKAGFSAGASACVLWQFILRHVPAPTRCRMILRWIWIPFTLAGSLAFILPIILGHTDPLGFGERLVGVISRERIDSFLTVWWAHIGAYLGLIIGLLTAIAMSRIKVESNDIQQADASRARC